MRQNRNRLPVVNDVLRSEGRHRPVEVATNPKKSASSVAEYSPTLVVFVACLSSANFFLSKNTSFVRNDHNPSRSIRFTDVIQCNLVHPHMILILIYGDLTSPRSFILVTRVDHLRLHVSIQTTLLGRLSRPQLGRMWIWPRHIYIYIHMGI